MTTMKILVVRHPVASYFALTFAVSWGVVLLVIGGPAGMTGVKAQDNSLFPFAVLAMLAGPSVTGLLLTGFIDGKQGLRGVWSRLLRWRVGARWYAVALLGAPLLAITISLTLSRFSSEFIPGILVAADKAAVVRLGLVVGLTAGFFEELGWTGFAIPHLKRRHGVLVTGLIVGLLWSAWHWLVVAWGIGNRAGTVPLAVFVALDGLGGLPAFRVMMVWVYDRTDSLFVAMLMHLSLTACTLIVTPQTTGVALLAYGLLFAGAVWVVMAAVAVANRHHLSGHPLRGRIA